MVAVTCLKDFIFGQHPFVKVEKNNLGTIGIPQLKNLKQKFLKLTLRILGALSDIVWLLLVELRLLSGLLFRSFKQLERELLAVRAQNQNVTALEYALGSTIV